MDCTPSSRLAFLAGDSLAKSGESGLVVRTPLACGAAMARPIIMRAPPHEAMMSTVLLPTERSMATAESAPNGADPTAVMPSVKMESNWRPIELPIMLMSIAPPNSTNDVVSSALRGMRPSWRASSRFFCVGASVFS